MSDLRRLAWLVSGILLTACSPSVSTSSSPSNAASVAIATAIATPLRSAAPIASATPTPTPAATPVPTPAGLFMSRLYGYSLTSVEWSGTPTATAWDGTGAPGDGDPFVDALQGPNGARAWAYGEPTTATLGAFAATSRTTNASVHPCPVEPETTRKTTVGGQPAIIDVHDCGVVALTAYVVRAGRVDVFFTYGSREDETAIRTGFDSLLETVSFE